jgi:adenylosuccinate lyase
MPVWRGEGTFMARLLADPEVTDVLTPQELEGLFDLGYHFRHVDTIFTRVFGAASL